MSWIQRLYETYENNISQVGIVESEEMVPLLPMFHTTAKAQIEVVIDERVIFKSSYFR